MKTSNKLSLYLRDIVNIMSREFKIIATSYSLLLVITGGIIAYGLLYNYMYKPNVIRNAPVVVVDKSNTKLSREYSRLLDATPQIEVYGHEGDFIAAKELMKENKVIGIVYIPKDFDTKVNRGEEAIFISFAVTDAFLFYSSLQEAASGAMLGLNDRYRKDMVVFLPQNSVAQIASTNPITVSGNALFNYTDGYGTYLIPGVLMLIIYQTLFMVIGMINGDERGTGKIKIFAEQGVSLGRVSRIIIGKSFVYCSIYALFCFFLIGLVPYLFQLPNIGHVYNTVILMIPYVLATCFLGLTATILFTDSETAVIMIPFFSVGLVFLSGISYPLELIPWYWKVVHYMLPAAPGTLAYVKLNSMGASIADIKSEYITLWLQCFIYFFTACLAYRYNIKKAIGNKI